MEFVAGVQVPSGRISYQQRSADLLSPLMELRADKWNFDQVVY